MENGLNENHKRQLLFTFQHVDRLLANALRDLDSSGTPSPFQTCRTDSLPIQRKVMTDYVARMREMMRRILADQGIAIPDPGISSLWSFRTTLLSARIAVEELGPKYMRGYGQMSEEAAHLLKVLTTQLTDVLDRMGSYLARGAGQELEVRLARLEKHTDEADTARVLVQVIDQHGLVEMRPSLESVIDRLESFRFEVGVFGRVSSGKSSLLDRILRTDALPVGVTPVTAVPTRVSFGSRPSGTIWFAEAEPISVTPGELAQYVTEQGNPDNTRHVTRIEVRLPAGRLKEGVVFVDTPGLGSLARYGGTESLAYLPRCDLGVVLVDASGSLVHEDLAVIAALRQAGAEVMVVLTKADMLGCEDRIEAARYVRSQLEANLGFDPPVHLISVKGPDAELCDRWYESTLELRLEKSRTLAQASLRRKIGLLREAVISALRNRLDRKTFRNSDERQHWGDLETAFNNLLADFENAGRERLEWPDLPDRLFEAAARQIVEQWRRDHNHVDAAEALALLAGKEVHDHAIDAAKPFESLRTQCKEALETASTLSGITFPQAHEEPPRIAGMPVFDLLLKSSEANLRKPWWAFLPEKIVCRRVKADLAARHGNVLTSRLEQYVRQLERWRFETLASLRADFAAKADLYRSQYTGGLDVPDREAIMRDLRRLESTPDQNLNEDLNLTEQARA